MLERWDESQRRRWGRKRRRSRSRSSGAPLRRDEREEEEEEEEESVPASCCIQPAPLSVTPGQTRPAPLSACFPALLGPDTHCTLSLSLTHTHTHTRSEETTWRRKGARAACPPRTPLTTPGNEKTFYFLKFSLCSSAGTNVVILLRTHTHTHTHTHAHTHLHTESLHHTLSHFQIPH